MRIHIRLLTILVLCILRLLILGLTVLRGLRILLISGIRVGLRSRILRLLVSLLLCLTVLGLLILLLVFAGVRVLLRIVVWVGQEFPGLSWVDDSPTKTLAGIRRITEECVEDTSQQKNHTTRLIA